MLNFIMGNFCC